MQECIIVNLHHIIPRSFLSRYIPREHGGHAREILVTFALIHILFHINHMDIPESIILPFQERVEHFIVRGRFAEDETQGYSVEGIERVVFIGFA